MVEEKSPDKKRESEEEKKEPVSPEERGLNLWRLLQSPEEGLTEEAPSKAEQAKPEEPSSDIPPDADEAALRFQREAITSIGCRNHPDVPAISECPICNSYYCRDCMVVRKGRLMCRTCAETEFAPTEEELLERIVRGEEEDEGMDVLPETPPEFNPISIAGGGEGAISSPIRRVIAFALDIAILRVFYFVSVVILSIILHAMSGGSIPSVVVLGEGDIVVGLKIVLDWIIHFRPLPLILSLDFFYFFISYAMVNRTIGMSWLNLRIVTMYGDFVGPIQAFVRALVLVITFGISIILSLLLPRRMGLHDLFAQTLEINFSGLKRVDVYESVNVKF